jgi:hypothetical protein
MATLIEKIIQRMEVRGYKIFRRPGEKNIVYIEGGNENGTANTDEPNHFNDLRIVFAFNGKQPVIEGIWDATTEPGYYYTDNPMNPAGAARIAFDQYTAWAVGLHGNSEPHEALVQVGLVKVYRDYNRDMIRTGDNIDEGIFGINQHWGYDLPIEDIGLASAGCLVGRTRRGHEKFMRLVKSDLRYRIDRDFVFTTTILDAIKVNNG